MAPWIWASLAVVACLLEIAFTDMTMFGIATGAMFGGVTALFVTSLPAQSIAASIGILAFVMILRPLLIGRRQRRSTTLVDGLIGNEGQTVKPITDSAPGSVKIRGEVWQARSDHPIAIDTPVLVTAVDGATLTVIEK